MHQRAFAGAVLASESDGFACFDAQIEIGQHRRSIRIRERHVAKLYRARPRRWGRRHLDFKPFAALRANGKWVCTIIRRLRRFRQRRFDARECCAHRLRLAVEVGERAHRSRHEGRVEQERDQRTGPQRLRRHPISGEPQHNQHCHPREPLHHRRQTAGMPQLAVFKVADCLVHLRIARGFKRLSIERLDDRDQAKIFFRAGEGLPMRLIERRGERAHFSSQDLDDEVEEGNGRNRQQCKGCVDPPHEIHRAQ